ncbi:MAG: hypothetical protein BWY18_00038 [Candidatus Cloacimonetes bacterium ADurb.Bin211]|nr:MAG: hypothetical protein BWY18_00038 [Candidatus Cloacimonetes bacterium ADurb.Bin211]
MPESELDIVAVPEGETEPPILFKSKEIVTVSPGSNIPLLLPVGSYIVIFPNSSAGAEMVLENS